MPTYEYECLSCGNHFEKFQKMTDAPVKTCPKCRKRVRRLIGSGSGIIFKGSGFYATDYRKPDKTQKDKEHKQPQDKHPQDKEPTKKQTSETKDKKSS